MSGNTSGALDARWQLLRCLYAGEAAVLPLSADDLAHITGLPVASILKRTSNWVIPGRKGARDALAGVVAMRAEAASLARQTLDLLAGELAALKRGGVEESDEKNSAEDRLKVLISLSKTFQTLEEGINRMEKACQDDDRYPSDVLEFRAELEKYIRALEEDGQAS